MNGEPTEYTAHLVAPGARGPQYDEVKVPLDGGLARHFLADLRSDGKYTIWETGTASVTGAVVVYRFADTRYEPGDAWVIDRTE